MANFTTLPITSLRPGTSVLDTDVYAAVDVTDLSQSPSGTTKKYTVQQLSDKILINAQPWTEVTITTFQMEPNNGYISITNTLCNLILPVSCSQGDIIKIQGQGSGFLRISQNSAQQILNGQSQTSVGPGGYLETTHANDSFELLCIADDTLFTVRAPYGAITTV